MEAEYLAYRSLALACLGEVRAASRACSEARKVYGPGVETRTLTAWAEAISALKSGAANRPQTVRTAFGVTDATGGFDAFVTAARAFPPLITALLDTKCDVNTLRDVLARSNDFRLGRAVGLDPRYGASAPLSELTPRELEVARLVASGATNSAIAARLVISDSTVKVHVRHILEKLNAQTRTEVAAIVARHETATSEARLVNPPH
jgi:DNA-binding CsgD family transcriptional regulator